MKTTQTNKELNKELEKQSTLKTLLIRIKVLGAFAPLVLLAACGGKLADETGSTAGAPAAESPALSSKVLNNSRAICDGEACHSSIGMLLIKSNGAVNSCMAFLSSQNQIMTVGDCIPKEIASAGAHCQDQIFAYFPQNSNFTAEKINCNRVEKIFPNDILGHPQNVAVLSLVQSTKRPILKMVRDGFQDQSRYNVFKIKTEFNGQQYLGHFQLDTCLPNPGNYVVNDYVKSNSPHFSLSRCGLPYGGKGSAVLNNNGKVLGLLEETLPPGDERARLENLGYHFLTDQVRTVTRGINFACLLLNSGDPLPADCSAPIPVTPDAIILAETSLIKALPDSFQSDIVGLDLRYQWDVRTLDTNSPEVLALNSEVAAAKNTSVLIPIPKCIANMSGLRKDLNYHSRKNEPMSIGFTMPLYEMQSGLDGTFRAQAAVNRPLRTSNIEYRYSADDVLNGNSPLVQVGLFNRDGKPILNTKILTSCPN